MEMPGERILGLLFLIVLPQAARLTRTGPSVAGRTGPAINR
jgi:hypothetical protein